MGINKVMITGNLTRDPELREMPSGMAVLRFCVAVNDRRKNQQTGEWEDYANFVDCTMFGNRATSVSKFINKGSKVAIEGKLNYSTWEKDGVKRSKLSVNVNEIEFMSRSNGGDGGYNGGYNNAAGSGYNNAGSYDQAQASYQDDSSQYNSTPDVDMSEPAYKGTIPF